MKLFYLILTLGFLLKSHAQEQILLVGTYDSPKSEGVYVYRFNSNTGESKAVGSIKTPNPSFIVLSPDEKFLYAVSEVAPAGGKGGDIVAFSLEKQTGSLRFINKQPSGGDHPCHVEIDRTGKWVFAANYSSGSLSVLPVQNDGSLGTGTTISHEGAGPHSRQKAPHVHCNIISHDNKWLFTADLGIDKLMIYSFDAFTGKLTPARQPYSRSKPGSGPRHFTIHPQHKFAYLLEELTGTVNMYKYKKGKLKARQRISSMPYGDTSFAGSADIHVSRDGNFLYASNRGNSNTIAIFSVNKRNGRLKPLAHQSTLGRTPRNFSIDPSGKYLLVANQNSDEIVIFNRDVSTGLLSDTGKRIQVGKPVCLRWGTNE